MRVRKKAPPGRGSRDTMEIDTIVDQEAWELIKEVMNRYDDATISELKKGLEEKLGDYFQFDFVPQTLDELFEPDVESFTMAFNTISEDDAKQAFLEMMYSEEMLLEVEDYDENAGAADEKEQ